MDPVDLGSCKEMVAVDLVDLGSCANLHYTCEAYGKTDKFKLINLPNIALSACFIT